MNLQRWATFEPAKVSFLWDYISELYMSLQRWATYEPTVHNWTTYEVAEWCWPGGEYDPDEDEPLPEGQLHHVQAVLVKHLI